MSNTMAKDSNDLFNTDTFKTKFRLTEQRHSRKLVTEQVRGLILGSVIASSIE